MVSVNRKTDKKITMMFHENNRNSTLLAKCDLNVTFICYNVYKFRRTEVQPFITSSKEGQMMDTAFKKIAFWVTPDMEPIMDEAKKMFDKNTRSEVIRMLISIGLKTQKENRAKPVEKVKLPNNE